MRVCVCERTGVRVVLTNKEAAGRWGGAILVFQELAEEGGEAGDGGGETALGQDQQHVDRAQQHPQKEPWEP